MAVFSVTLDAQPDQYGRLLKLQTAFALLCNDLAPFVSAQQCWNRVTLHHLKYRELRSKYPEIGSQMVCNAIYAVSKVSRLVYQHPSSPYNVKKLAGKKLPTIRYSDSCPVYFDSHTLTVTDRHLSMYTMDGRIKFQLLVSSQQRTMLATRRLQEITLNRGEHDKFMLTFFFDEQVLQGAVQRKPSAVEPRAVETQALALPEYVGLEEGR